MKKVLILLALMSFGVAAKEEPKECVVHDHGGGATVIACPEYVVTKTPDKTVICRLMQGNPNPICTKIP